MKWRETAEFSNLIIPRVENSLLKISFIVFAENMIDREALMCLTERACEKLIPVMGHRIKFLKLLTKEKSSNDSKHTLTSTAIWPEDLTNIEKQTEELQARYVTYLYNSGNELFLIQQ